MQISHRIAAHQSDPFWIEADRLGLPFKRGQIIMVLTITESDQHWPEVEHLATKYELGIHQVVNLFTKRELDSAEWLEMYALGHHGYPQPERDFAYPEATYHLADFCANCGIGGNQNAAFRLRSEPKASHSQFLQLNWVFGEFFVRDAAREGLRAAGMSGIEFIPAVLHMGGLPSTQVTQMKVTRVLPPALETLDLQPVSCKRHNEEWHPGQSPLWVGPQDGPFCDRVKYHAGQRGQLKFARQAFQYPCDVVMTNEWFGSGARAFRKVLVSQRFRQVVVANGWRGVKFQPVELFD